MITGIRTPEIWLPVSVLSWSVSVPIGILRLWGSIPMSQNEALELMRAEFLFKLKFYEWVLWIFFMWSFLCTCGVLHRANNGLWSKFKINLENCMFFIYCFYIISAQPGFVWMVDSYFIYFFCLWLNTSCRNWLVFKDCVWKVLILIHVVRKFQFFLLPSCADLNYTKIIQVFILFKLKFNALITNS